MDYYKLTPMATLSHLKTSSSGLVYREVAIRQRAYGRNTISIGRKVPFVRRRLYQFKNHLKQWPASIQRACQALSACEPLPGKGLCLAGHDGISAATTLSPARTIPSRIGRACRAASTSRAPL